MNKNYITKTDLINMYNENKSNLKDIFVKMQTFGLNENVRLQYDYDTEKFNCYSPVRDHHDCTSGIVVFETLCHCKDNPDEEFYKNIDCIVDGYNQGLEYYLNELD